MVLWNRIVRNLENAKDLLGKWIAIFAERIRIEMHVMKILVEKAAETVEQEEAEKLGGKIVKGATVEEEIEAEDRGER